MSDFKTRLLDERIQLFEKVQKLDEFIDSEMYESISETQQELLVDQLSAMSEYLDCLEARLDDLDIRY